MWVARKSQQHEDLCARVPLGAQLVKLHEQGFTWREIADEFGVSLTFVYMRAQRAQDDPEPAAFMACARCGMEVGRHGWTKHREMCERLPLPADLLAEFEQPGVLIQDLRRKYNANYDTIVGRLALAREAQEAEVLLPVVGPACVRCGVRLDHPLVARVGLRCAWCVAEENGERPYLEASLPAMYVGVAG